MSLCLQLAVAVVVGQRRTGRIGEADLDLCVTLRTLRRGERAAGAGCG